jgi:glycosyltransferase involved in cell wall biosynthesis
VFVDTLPQYRVPFFNGVRATLAKHGIRYDLIVGDLDPKQATKGDQGRLGWERQVNNRFIRVGPILAVWQPVLKEIWNCDLAIVGQENRLLTNYIAQIFGMMRPSRLAFWGHGRNFQARSKRTLAETWKRRWATRCDWWFTYTDATSELIESYGFPRERITVFYNAIDTSALRRWDSEIGVEELACMRRQLGIATTRVAVYVGALYDHKRVAFLLEAATEIRRRIPDFILIFMGSGPDRHVVEKAAAAHPWIRYLGPRFGREKAAILKLGRVSVMPGLVGLGILDGSALGVPMVTTGYPYHSPEIAYLKHGENGLMVQDWTNSAAYADAAAAVLCDDVFHAKLAAGARLMADTYTIERMIQSFCDGVLAALAAPKRRSGITP